MSGVSGISVRTLIGVRTDAFGLPLELIAGARGLDRLITSPHPQKTGLALAGFHEYLKPGRVLIFGESEVRFLEGLDRKAQPDAVRLALGHDFPCILITGGLTLPSVVAAEAERVALPILRKPLSTPTAIAKLGTLLEDHLAERISLHAVLMDVLGLGVLICGESGIGTGLPKPYQTTATAPATSANRPKVRSMMRLRMRGMRRIAASQPPLNQILWFVRLRNDKESNCRWAAKITWSNA